MKKPEGLKDLFPEVDYQALMAQMPGQSHPRRKLRELQNKGYLIRLKKGFYVLSPQFTGRHYSLPIVANLLYGPSYLSFEYALSLYGLIPERVEVLTSVTTQKNKNFETPIGFFTYRHLPLTLYPHGVALRETTDGRTFLIATPEKALLDIFTLKFRRETGPKTTDVVSALENDLRVNINELRKLASHERLGALRELYRNRHWCKLLIDYLLEQI
jgi:predicted transcriptional regulator of viral defense system